MATRLYPGTTDRTVLARLAGVPETTWERLDQLNQAEQERESWSSQRDLYRELSPDEEVARLETFVLFGWGRADFRALQQTGLDPSCDATQNLELVQQLITAHGVDLYGVDVAELGGLDWS